MSTNRLPRWLKLVFSVWIFVWAVTWWILLGPQNYFWLCNLASFLILAALWSEHRLLMSMQWLAVALVGLFWSFDVSVAALTGVHPIGGTEYMFDPDHPLMARLMSLYHVVLPLVAGYGIIVLGYAHRALIWQTLLTWVLIPPTYWFTDPEKNINWVHGPFGQHQDLVTDWVYLIALMLVWPVILHWPVHLLMLWLQRRGWLRRHS